MREPRPIPGATAPLFDRFTAGGADVSGEIGRSVLDAGALRDQVRDDLARLLNTRSSLRGRAAEIAEGTVLNYGLPDFSALSANSEADRNTLAEVVAERIRRHEPRLEGVQVIVREIPENPMAVTGLVLARLRMGPVSEPVSFRISLDTHHPEHTVNVT